MGILLLLHFLAFTQQLNVAGSSPVGSIASKSFFGKSGKSASVICSLEAIMETKSVALGKHAIESCKIYFDP